MTGHCIPTSSIDHIRREGSLPLHGHVSVEVQFLVETKGAGAGKDSGDRKVSLQLGGQTFV